MDERVDDRGVVRLPSLLHQDTERLRRTQRATPGTVAGHREVGGGVIGVPAAVPALVMREDESGDVGEEWQRARIAEPISRRSAAT